MVATTKQLVRETQALLGYTQSDEISLAWLSDSPENQPLFGGKVHKLTSVLASLTAAQFQLALAVSFERDEAKRLSRMAPHFDARVLQLPSKTETANMFLWRALDARKNSINMAAQVHFPQNTLHRRDERDMRTMLAKKGLTSRRLTPPASSGERGCDASQSNAPSRLKNWPAYQSNIVRSRERSSGDRMWRKSRCPNSTRSQIGSRLSSTGRSRAQIAAFRSRQQARP
jgi:hypothetical protein